MEVTNINITILSRLSAEILVDTHFPENTVVISFYDPDGIPLDYGVFSKNVLPVPVDDFQINLPQADRIAEFVSKAVSNGQDIICQCERGRNRSAACAAVLLWAAPTSRRTGFVKIPFIPSASGPQDSTAVPFSAIFASIGRCW